jgi:hypothetical protein
MAASEPSRAPGAGPQVASPLPDPLAAPRVITPPGAVMKKVAPDPNKEERKFRDRLHRALRNMDRGKPSGLTPECDVIVKQIADEQPLMRSLRADTRGQARDRVTALTGQFREREC